MNKILQYEHCKGLSANTDYTNHYLDQTKTTFNINMLIDKNYFVVYDTQSLASYIPYFIT